MTFSRTDFDGIELRLLLQVADARALRGPGLAGILLVEAGHDAQQRRFAGAVDAEHADLGVGIELQVDVLQDFPVPRINLGEALHVINELTGHILFGDGRPVLARCAQCAEWELDLTFCSATSAAKG